MDKAYASCPASVSFIFSNRPSRNLTKMGSVGVGCTIDREVLVEVEESSVNETIFNGATINFPTVESVINTLSPSPVKVSIQSPLPLGCGFGISGASALAAAAALNKLFNLKKTIMDLAKIAHTAEIVNHTGLGSVATQITGGFLLKKRPGLPVSAIKLPLVGQKLYAVIIDRLITPSILKDDKKIQKVNAAADYYLQQLKNIKSPQLKDVIDVSYNFVSETGLLTDKRVINIIGRIRKAGGSATMAILGKVVITNIKPWFTGDYKIEELTITD